MYKSIITFPTLYCRIALKNCSVMEQHTILIAFKYAEIIHSICTTHLSVYKYATLFNFFGYFLIKGLTAGIRSIYTC
jgi:hypothetical protein